jgi:two-component system OmpR family response regulator
LLRRYDRDRPQRLTVGPVSIDALRRKATSHEREVTLTPREFALLEYLMSNAETPLAKSDILSAVWGTDFDGDPNIVEVYIGYLRRKIDTPGHLSIIRTVRGVGYTVSAS